MLLCLEPRYELIILKCIYLILTPLSFIFITSLDIITCEICYSLTINKVIDVYFINEINCTFNYYFFLYIEI